MCIRDSSLSLYLSISLSLYLSISLSLYLSISLSLHGFLRPATCPGSDFSNLGTLQNCMISFRASLPHLLEWGLRGSGSDFSSPDVRVLFYHLCQRAISIFVSLYLCISRCVPKTSQREYPWIAELVKGYSLWLDSPGEGRDVAGEAIGKCYAAHITKLLISGLGALRPYTSKCIRETIRDID